MSMWILTMLIYPAKDFCTHPSPRKLHRERRSSEETLRETTLTNMEERRELIIEPLPCSLPHKSHKRMGTHCITGSPCRILSTCVDDATCLGHRDLVRSQRKERSTTWPSPSPKPRRLKKRQWHCWSLCELLCGAWAHWKLPPTMTLGGLIYRWDLTIRAQVKVSALSLTKP